MHCAIYYEQESKAESNTVRREYMVILTEKTSLTISNLTQFDLRRDQKRYERYNGFKGKSINDKNLVVNRGFRRCATRRRGAIGISNSPGPPYSFKIIKYRTYD